MNESEGNWVGQISVVGSSLALQAAEVPLDYAADLPALQEIAGRSFKHERDHIDTRLDPRLADERYSRWVGNSMNGGNLSAVPGQGYRRSVWQAMLRSHQADGCNCVTTTVSARNVAVINLYGQFRFLPPERPFID